MSDKPNDDQLKNLGERFQAAIDGSHADGGRVLTLTDDDVVVIPLPLFNALRGRKREDGSMASDFGDWNQNSDGVFGDASDITSGAD